MEAGAVGLRTTRRRCAVEVEFAVIDVRHVGQALAEGIQADHVGVHLAEAQGRGEPRIVGQLLRAAAVVRIVTPGLVDLSDTVLDEMLAHCRRHGLLVLEAEAHALRGRRYLLGGFEDRALTEVASGLAMLEEDLAPDPMLDKRTWDRLLASALQSTGLVLTQLGVYEMADEVLVMYAGRCVEFGPTKRLLTMPEMPYTWGLLSSVPDVTAPVDAKLIPIRGNPPSLLNPPPGCAFSPRCDHSDKVEGRRCWTELPELTPARSGGAHVKRCHLENPDEVYVKEILPEIAPDLVEGTND